MTRVQIIGVILILGLLFWAIKKGKELSEQNKIKEFVAWCVIDSAVFTCPRDLELHGYVLKAQDKMQILPKYRIAEEEWEIVRTLIVNFKKEITQKYFCNSLHLPESKHVIGEEAYFMYLLQEYLEHHQCDYSFLGYEMHKEVVSKKDYGSWGGPLYDATYVLTDFAVVLHKLYYIAYMFCKNSTELNPTQNYFNDEHSIEEIIDSKRISISRM